MLVPRLWGNASSGVQQADKNEIVKLRFGHRDCNGFRIVHNQARRTAEVQVYVLDLHPRRLKTKANRSARTRARAVPLLDAVTIRGKLMLLQLS